MTPNTTVHRTTVSPRGLGDMLWEAMAALNVVFCLRLGEVRDGVNDFIRNAIRQTLEIQLNERLQKERGSHLVL